jgi:hypothetical protein
MQFHLVDQPLAALGARIMGKSEGERSSAQIPPNNVA